MVVELLFDSCYSTFILFLNRSTSFLAVSNTFLFFKFRIFPDNKRFLILRLLRFKTLKASSKRVPDSQNLDVFLRALTNRVTDSLLCLRLLNSKRYWVLDRYIQIIIFSKHHTFARLIHSMCINRVTTSIPRFLDNVNFFL